MGQTDQAGVLRQGPSVPEVFRGSMVEVLVSEELDRLWRAIQRGSWDDLVPAYHDVRRHVEVLKTERDAVREALLELCERLVLKHPKGDPDA